MPTKSATNFPTRKSLIPATFVIPSQRNHAVVVLAVTRGVKPMAVPDVVMTFRRAVPGTGYSEWVLRRKAFRPQEFPDDATLEEEWRKAYQSTNAKVTDLLVDPQRYEDWITLYLPLGTPKTTRNKFLAQLRELLKPNNGGKTP